MGTRHLTVIKKDNEYKLISYGQWDWYPSWQGKNILELLRDMDMVQLMDNVDTMVPTNDVHVSTLCKASKNWEKDYPQFSRDTGTKIIKLIYDTPNLPILDPKQEGVLEDMKPNVWIEYSYIVDLDQSTLEVHTGTPLDKKGKPNTPVKSYDLHNLPTTEQFLLDINAI